jgi:hypothetical protein
MHPSAAEFAFTLLRYCVQEQQVTIIRLVLRETRVYRVAR